MVRLRGARQASLPVVPKVLQRPATDAAGWPRHEPPWLRRAVVGVVAVAGEQGHLVDVLDAVERSVAARPEMELLSARRRLRAGDD